MLRRPKRSPEQARPTRIIPPIKCLDPTGIYCIPQRRPKPTKPVPMHKPDKIIPPVKVR